MNFAIDSYCLVCFLQRNIELVRPLGTEEQTTEFAKRIRLQKRLPGSFQSEYQRTC